MTPEHTYLAAVLVWLGQLLVDNADTVAAQLLATGTVAVTLVGLLTRYAPLLGLLKPFAVPVWHVVKLLLPAKTTPKDGK